MKDANRVSEIRVMESVSCCLHMLSLKPQTDFKSVIKWRNKYSGSPAKYMVNNKYEFPLVKQGYPKLRPSLSRLLHTLS